MDFKEFTELELVEMELHVARGGAFAPDDVGRLLKALRLWNERAHKMLKDGLDLAAGLNDSALKLEDAGAEYKRKYEAALLQNGGYRKALEEIAQNSKHVLNELFSGCVVRCGRCMAERALALKRNCVGGCQCVMNNLECQYIIRDGVKVCTACGCINQNFP